MSETENMSKLLNLASLLVEPPLPTAPFASIFSLMYITTSFSHLIRPSFLSSRFATPLLRSPAAPFHWSLRRSVEFHLAERTAKALFVPRRGRRHSHIFALNAWCFRGSGERYGIETGSHRGRGDRRTHFCKWDQPLLLRKPGTVSVNGRNLLQNCLSRTDIKPELD